MSRAAGLRGPRGTIGGFEDGTAVSHGPSHGGRGHVNRIEILFGAAGLCGPVGSAITGF